jgi:hypothetical protein
MSSPSTSAELLKKQLKDAIEREFEQIHEDLKQWNDVVVQLSVKMENDRITMLQELRAVEFLLKAMEITQS